MGRHDADPRIYEEMVDKARRAGTTAPDGDTTWASVSMTFEHDDGSTYERIDPNEVP